MRNELQSPPPPRVKRIHSYAASFGEDFARDLLSAETEPGQIVLDPFTGASTSITQARILGRSVIGVDVDPIACLIARVLTNPYEVDALDALERCFLNELERCEASLTALPFRKTDWAPGATRYVGGVTATVPREPGVEFWFAEEQRAVLAVAMGIASHTEDHLKDIIRLAVSSSIIHKWPNTVSLARDIDHSRPHRTERSDLELSDQFTIFRKSFLNAMRILGRLNLYPNRDGYSSRIIEADAETALKRLENESVDYVLTSPPYFNAIDYPRAHQIARWWLWPESQRLVRASYIGLKPVGKDALVVASATAMLGKVWHRVPTATDGLLPNEFRRFCRYVMDLDAVIAGIHRVLRTAGTATLILGNNKIRGVHIPVVDVVTQMLERNGFSKIRIDEREIATNRRRYPYGLKGFRGLMNIEFIIRAQKG